MTKIVYRTGADGELTPIESESPQNQAQSAWAYYEKKLELLFMFDPMNIEHIEALEREDAKNLNSTLFYKDINENNRLTKWKNHLRGYYGRELDISFSPGKTDDKKIVDFCEELHDIARKCFWTDENKPYLKMIAGKNPYVRLQLYYGCGCDEQLRFYFNKKGVLKHSVFYRKHEGKTYKLKLEGHEILPEYIWKDLVIWEFEIDAFIIAQKEAINEE